MRWALLVWLSLHLALITCVSGHDVCTVAAQGLTISPPQLQPEWLRAANFTEALTDTRLPASNPGRQALRTYLHCSGIDAGYGFFAPNVPESHKLLFELHHADGTITYQLPRVGSTAAALRLVSLLDRVVQVDRNDLREDLVRELSRSVWRAHPDVVKIRAVIASTSFPDPTAYKKGERSSYEIVYVQDLEPLKK